MDSIRVEGKPLLQNPAVSLRIEHLQELAQRRNEVTVDRVIAEYAKLAFLDIRKAFDGDGNLKPIHEMDDDTAAAIAGIEVDVKSTSVDGEALQTSKIHKLKLSDKKGSLDSLAKTMGMFVDRHETYRQRRC
jgi:phage terminase small subunit